MDRSSELRIVEQTETSPDTFPQSGPAAAGSPSYGPTLVRRAAKRVVALVGDDDLLRFSRAEVLRSAGFAALCIDQRHALVSLPLGHPDLSILFENVDTESALLITQRLRLHQPECAILRFPALENSVEESRLFSYLAEPGMTTARALIAVVENTLLAHCRP